MESDYHQELPADILEKLRHLELEYEDGDITLKGFEKKKASILAELSPHTTTPNSPSQDEAALLDEYGPEPSAADVVDFLDYLPSPTHSPVRSEGAALMEQNHLQLQQPYQQPEIHQLPPEPSFPAEYYPPSSSPQSRASVIPQYRPYGRPVNNPGYYNNTNNNNNSNTIGSPLPTNRPYMVSRNVYPPPGSNMIQPQHTMVQGNMLPPGNHPYMYNQRSSQPIYRPANNTQYQQRPMMYNNTQRPLHPSVSPRPMYAPINRPAPGNYINRPPMHSSQPMYGGRMDREYGPTMTGKRQDYPDQRQYSTMSMYSPRSDNDWDQ
ncbi:hypothetical protein BDB01DRAFT_841792 [Pilobolus umbonatus]|nr:hypothetical protein BDB01DRAFT_841792 [Pilobolus umbonatus]